MSDHFTQVEELFDRLLAAAQEALSDEESNEVRHFIDVGEYGLALETIVGIFVEENKTAGADVISQIEGLATKMLMDPKPLVQKLRS